ncbi:MAG: hypothetical protein IPL39_16660 [Opitutaceae bacterium]|nr:hypothetical protein [Opitutaceae bacterium]
MVELGTTPTTEQPCACSAPAKAAFLRGFEKIVAAHQPLEGELTLGNPPAWGKTIAADTRGVLTFERAFAHGFVGRLLLENLVPDHEYILTLNGNPKLAGNLLLPDAVPGLKEEKYYDFLHVRTDAAGRFEGMLGVHLQPGSYAVRLYVKDADDFKIVLYHDYFPFTVTKYEGVTW